MLNSSAPSIRAASSSSPEIIEMYWRMKKMPKALAEHWATAYWSEDYSAWSQIPIPVGNHNPGLLLAFQQFITGVYVDFQRAQLDAILYWQWRSALGGQEQMHGTLIAPDGKPRPVYAEIAQLGQELHALPDLDDTQVSAEIALLHTYADRWAINFQGHHRDIDPVAHLLNYYRPLRT